MNSNLLPLNSYKTNIYSQNGEDGIILEILKRLKLTENEKYWCVEFGAWDGIHMSNTFALVENGWNAIYIEGSEKRYKDLLKTTKKYNRIQPINAFVAQNKFENNSLEKLLQTTTIPKNFEILSIDIDSYDLDIWDSLEVYEPKIVIIEINSSVPPGIYWRHSNKTQGNTFSSTLKVGNSKGYTLVCHTGNLIFIRNELIKDMNFPDYYIDNPEQLFINDWVTYGLFESKITAIKRLIKKILL
jgi:hypothetical protein